MAVRETYRWSAPTSVEAEVGPVNGQGGWTAVASLEGGRWSHCELWFSGTPAYITRPWRILGRIGRVWAVLASGTINVPALLAPNPTQLTGILGKVRGQPVEAIVAQVANSVGAVVPPAVWRLHAWGEDCCPQPDPTGALVVAPVIWTPVHDPAPSHAVYVASVVPCLVNCAFARNDLAEGEDRWFQVHDVAIGLAPGAVPVLPGLRVRPGCSVSQSYDAGRFTVGCWLVSSLTPATYTPDSDRAGLDMGALIQ